MGRLPLPLLLLALASCRDGGTALSVTLRLKGPAGCVRLVATGPSGEPLSVDVPAAAGSGERTLSVAVYPGRALGSGTVSLVATAHGAASCTGEPWQRGEVEATFRRGKVTAVALPLLPLGEDADGDGVPDPSDCAPANAARFPHPSPEAGAECGNAEDDNCDGTADEGCPCPADTSRPCYPHLPTSAGGVGSCTLGVQSCTGSAWGTCAGAVAPAEERCNGLDDDCDGAADEDVPGTGASCDTEGLGACRAGALACTDAGLGCVPASAPAADTCNGVDDDCDGTTDEDFPGLGEPCDAGVGACLRYGTKRCLPDGGAGCDADAGLPATDLCNGVDDDCNGTPDDAFPELGTACDAGVGTCLRAGARACTGSGLDTACNAVPGQAAPAESCNGLDDDCDGQVDEGIPSLGTLCSVGQGACLGNGAIACMPDGGTGCNAPLVSPAPAEACDGRDDDCDGQVDEDFPTLGLPCDAGVGACLGTGIVACSPDGGSVRCNAPLIAGGLETCNGVDDDCNGQVDEQPGCGGPRADVAENGPTSWGITESIDEFIGGCAVRVSGRVPGPTTYSLAAETTTVFTGTSSVRMDYAAPGERFFAAHFPASRDANWDLRGTTGITFRIKMSLPPGVGLQAAPSQASPAVVLCAPTGVWVYTPTAGNVLSTGWTQHLVPLAGGGGWTRTTYASLNLSQVDLLEVHVNPSRGAAVGTVQVYLDDVRFY